MIELQKYEGTRQFIMEIQNRAIYVLLGYKILEINMSTDLFKKIEQCRKEERWYEILAIVSEELIREQNLEGQISLYNERGISNGKLGNFEAQIFDITKMILLDNTNPWAYCCRGDAFREIKKYDLAKKDFYYALKLQPDYASAHLDLGVILNDEKDYDEATKHLNLIINHPNPEIKGRAHANLGNTYYYKKEYNNSVLHFSKAIELISNAHFFRGRGASFFELKKIDEAISDFQYIIDILKLGEAQDYVNLGILRTEKKEFEKAIEAYEIALKLDNKNITALLNAGWIWIEKKDYSKAIEYYNKGIALGEALEKFYCSRGLAFQYSNFLDRAEKDYNKAEEINPNYEYIFLNRGVLLTERNKFQDAEKNFNRALEINNELPTIYNNRGRLWMKLNEYQLAKKDFYSALEQNLEDDDAHFNLSKIYSELEEYDIALSEAKKALGTLPLIGYNMLGVIHFNCGNYSEAVENYTLSLSYDSKQSLPLYNRAEAYRMIGEKGKALVDYGE
ncbi:MAG TPA: tetratricopeptide repeat protein, partial [Candidatus Kapabacteria bacterium]|nr:tetratricopeptide repeat protein [Candidatus Kapabacteria bacterium]